MCLVDFLQATTCLRISEIPHFLLEDEFALDFGWHINRHRITFLSIKTVILLLPMIQEGSCHFRIGILGQVWYLIVLIPDLFPLSYFIVSVQAKVCSQSTGQLLSQACPGKKCG